MSNKTKQNLMMCQPQYTLDGFGFTTDLVILPALAPVVCSKFMASQVMYQLGYESEQLIKQVKLLWAFSSKPGLIHTLS